MSSGSVQPPPRQSQRLKQHLPAIATALGLFATLWATLLGQTVPQLLRGDDATAFRSDVASVCSDALRDLDAWEPAPGAGLPNTFGRVQWLTRSVLPQFLAVAAPAQYKSDYARAVSGWRTMSRWGNRRGRTPLPNEPEIRDVMTTGNSPFYKFSNAVGDISIPECMTLSSRTGDIITRYTAQ
jgi:hypothetical protein